MSQLPINPLSPEEQQKRMGQIYLLMGKQVKSYHQHRHMGNNTSVPVEIAQELMESIEYTVGLVGGVYAHANSEEALHLGQEILESRLSKAKSMLELVNGTAPQWQTECRWEALRYLRYYLDHYDHLHLAHKGPVDLFYPVLISPPEGIQGIDSCLFYLNIMWIENQIMAGVSDGALDQFWDHLPDGTLNQCEQLLINGIGKALLDAGIDSLLFAPQEYAQLEILLVHAPADMWKMAAQRLYHWLDLRSDECRQYLCAAASLLSRLTENGACPELWGHLFIG